MALLATAPNDDTIVLAEKMATVSMLDARMLSSPSMESDPSRSARSRGMVGPSTVASTTASAANSENSAHRHQVLRSVRCTR